MINDTDMIRTGSYFDALPINVMHLCNHGSTRLHQHAFSELVVVLQGSGVHISPAGECSIGAGDVFVLHRGQEHGYHSASTLELVNILFIMDDLTLQLRDVANLPGYAALLDSRTICASGSFESKLRLSADRLASVSARLNEMLIEQKTRPEGWKFAMVGHFALIITEICRAYSERDNPAMRALTRLSGIIGYINGHYPDNLTLDDLANIACMSRRTLTREFRNAFGVSPIDYLIKERINRAMDLLRSSDMTITEASYRVGFQDSNYFARKFRAVVGCSPRDARKMFA